VLAELSIIGIIIAVVVAIVAAFLKRKQPEEEWDLPPELKPRRDQPPPQPAARSWEEELRRVLQDRPAPPPIVQPVPPPIPRPVMPRPAIPQAMEYDPEPHLQVELRVPPPQIEHTFQPFAGLTEATQRYAQAASIEQRVQQRMKHVTTHRAGTTSVQHTAMAPELLALVASLHNHKGARAAILASVILGPPRAFEES
jgi:hypothetical protein